MTGSRTIRTPLFVFMGFLTLSGDFMRAEDASQPGEVQPEPSTLHCLAVRWPVKGDDNENASIEVQYRKAGEKEWKKGFPLFRTLKEATPDQKNGQWNFSICTISPQRLPGGRIFAGSIVNLTPETQYDVKLSLKDPDGGDAERVLELKTIGEPKEPAGMKVKHVVPVPEGGGTGTEQDPIMGIAAAFAAAEPGDLMLLHKGVYKVSGAVELKKSGTAEKPIIFRGEGAEATVIDGGGDEKTQGRLISAEATRHIWLEDLGIQGRQYAIVAHEGSNWVIRRCTFVKMEKGFTAHNGGYKKSQGHFISDNVFIGPTAWPRTKGIESFCATYMSGAGHVVCYNRMEHVGDGLHGTGHGLMSASDIHNNEMNICTDDGFEMDYSETNVRAFHNRITNVAHGITAQPSQGGPLYIFRNTIYNATYSPFKLHNDTAGVFIFHNTCLRAGPCMVIQPANETVTDITTRNNLFIGTKGEALPTTGRMIRCDFDNDGYGGFTGAFATWNRKSFKTPDDAKKSGDLCKQFGAIVVDPKNLFASGLAAPADVNIEYKHAELDFRLKEDGAAIDKGVVLPNFNDDFKGKAPDLGAFELGDTPPHYGPRPKKN